MDKVFDSVGISAINGFVSRIQRDLTPAFVKWAQLVAGPAVSESKKQEVNKILEIVTDIVFAVINASNFSIAAGEMYYDLAVGTGAMLILEGDDDMPVQFISVPMSEISLDESKNGFIAGIFRTHSLPARGILHTWEDAKLTSDLFKIISDTPEKELEFKEITYFDPKDKVWQYEIIYNKEDRIVSRTYKSNPWIIVRWSKVAGEVFGRGPLLQALPDLKMLNKGKELAIRAAQLNIFGAYTVVDDGITNINTIKIAPNAMIPVKSNGGTSGASIQPLARTGDLNAQNFMFEELKQQINHLLLNERLPPDAGPVRSATEIVERIKQLQTDTGAAFGRLIIEFIQKVLQRVIYILEDKNIITFGGGIKIDNMAVTTQILSPLAKTQGLEDVNSIIQADQILRGVDPTGQLGMLTFKTDAIGSYVAEKLGVSAKLMNTEEEKTAIKQTMAQAAVAQAQQQQQPA